MRLLFDHNLSWHLVSRLEDLFPDSSHVVRHGLERAADAEVWDFARREGFTLVTKDADFHELSMQEGFPPKVVRIRVGNCKTAQIEAHLRQHENALRSLHNDSDLGILEL